MAERCEHNWGDTIPKHCAICNPYPKKDLPKLQSGNKPEFVKHFVETVNNLSNEEIAEIVWIFANERWSHGYEKGKSGEYE